MLSNFWDPYKNPNAVSRPRIRPVGGDGTNWGLTNLASDPSMPIPEPADHIGALWMMAQFYNAIADGARNGDAYAKQIVSLQAEHVLLSLGNGDRTAGLSVMSNGTYGVSAQDDGDWKADFLLNWFEITGSQDAINCLEGVIPGVLSRFKDTTVAQIDAGSGVLYSPLGLQYDTAGDGGAGQSSLYEVTLSVAALGVYDITNLGGYLVYAQAFSDILDTNYKVRATGKAPILARGIVLDPSLYGGAPRGTPINGDYAPEQNALDNGFAKPQRFGRANTLLLGMMSAVVLNARMWDRLGTAKYLSRALSLIDAMGQPDTAGGLIITQDVTVPGTYSPDDPWTGGKWAQRFVAEGLTLPGADKTGAVRAAMLKTAATIAASLSGGFYTADWCGARLAAATDGLLNGFTSFQARWDANPTGWPRGRASSNHD